MNYRNFINEFVSLGRFSFNILATSLTHPGKPFEIDTVTGKVTICNSAEEMRRAEARRQVNYLAPTVMAVYDETVGNYSTRERFEKRSREKLLEKILKENAPEFRNL